MQSYVKIHGCYSNRVNLHALFILHLIFYFFILFYFILFMYLKVKGKEYMIVVVCKKIETIKKKLRKSIF